MKIEVENRFKDYEKNHCWQYQMRVDSFESDLMEHNLTKEDVSNLKTTDFELDYVDSSDKSTCKEIVNFIHKHEWLGKMPNRPTHRFTARYNGILAGVIIMATPNTFSKLLDNAEVGGELLVTKEVEKLISRGACISWSPKNLGSKLIMFSINWMIKNTRFRLFSAYSDPEAKELGTIYQACNFTYIGQKSGGTHLYFDENTPHLGWISDRTFRKVGYYKKYAKILGIEWLGEWNEDKAKPWRISWDKMPEDVAKAIKGYSKIYMKDLEKRTIPAKHKYIYIKGNDKRETKELKKEFARINPKLVNLPYPRERGT